MRLRAWNINVADAAGKSFSGGISALRWCVGALMC